jgi:hypothetical protein
MRCRLCDAETGPDLVLGGLAYGDCPRCGFLGLDARHHPSPAAEAERYRKHRNDPAESGYRIYIEAFVEAAILPFAAKGAELLDFGSGPVPALGLILAERGIASRAYDPIFEPWEGWSARCWGAIALHEVAEHLREPGTVLASLVSLLPEGGILAIRTRFAPDDVPELERWWYRLDPTHIGFFRARSFAWLAGSLGLDLLLCRPPDLAVLRRPPP